MKSYFTYTFQVYKEVTEQGKLADYCEVEVIADSEEKALKKAMSVYVRPDYVYRVCRVANFQLVEHDKK